MRPEYEAIVAAGLILQLDSPDLGLGRHMMYKDRSDEDYLVLIGRHVEVLNHALRNVPADRVRMHVCWGNYEGPHHKDVEMRVILPTLMRAKPQGLLFETSNPRHQHDWQAFRDLLAAGARGQGADPRRDRFDHQLHRASRSGGAADRHLHQPGRPRAGDRGHRLRLLDLCRLRRDRPDIVYAKLATLAEGAARASDRGCGGRRRDPEGAAGGGRVDGRHLHQDAVADRRRSAGDDAARRAWCSTPNTRRSTGPRSTAASWRHASAGKDVLVRVPHRRRPSMC